jgi:diacylglycerol kinase family enzyme
MPDPQAPLTRQRWAAAAALLCAVVALSALLSRALGSLWDLLLVGLSLAVTAIAVWIAVANRGARRVAGLTVGLLGLLSALRVMIRTTEDVLGLLLAIGLGAVSLALARYALGRRVDSVVAADLDPAHPAAQHGVLIMNPRSGGGKAEDHDLEAECRARGIEPVVLRQGDDLVGLAREALARGADVIGMAGGDGSQALVAGEASAAGIPFVVVPAGTRNHFALDLGLDRDDVVGALDGFTRPVARTVDLARVNDRVFVNNASLGLYAEVVSSDEYRDAKVRTTLDTLPDLIGPDSEMPELRIVEADGSEGPAGHLLLISNNPYTLDTLGGMGTRARLDTGRLGVVSVIMAGRGDLRELVALEVAHKLDSYPGWREWEDTELEVLAEDGEVSIALDGEALTMPAPLRFEILPAALTVLLPAGAPGRSPAARTLDRDAPRQLWHVVRGHPVE